MDKQVSVGFHPGPERSDPLDDAEQAVGRVLGRVGGIVRECRPLEGSEELTPVQTYVARGSRRLPGWTLLEPVWGTGTSTEAHLAHVAAVAEAIECYCSMAPPRPEDLERTAYRDIEVRAVRPQSLIQAPLHQRRRHPTAISVPDTKVIDWVWTYSMTTAEPVLVPAALVHLGMSSGREFVGGRVSTGFACHVNLSQAVLTGLCEVLERDALAIAWHARVPLTPLDVQGTEAGEVARGLAERAGVTAHCYAVPNDGPFPVVLARGECEDAEPHAVVGVACRQEPEAAALKAMFEVCQVLVGLRLRRPPRPAKIRHLDDSAAFYASAPGAVLLDRHLLTGSKVMPLGDVPGVGAASAAPTGAGSGVHGLARAVVDYGVRWLAERGLEVLVAETTTADVATSGFRVLRVIVPGAVDISSDPRLAPLGATRMREVPARLGLRKRPLTTSQLNRLPVPLA